MKTFEIRKKLPPSLKGNPVWEAYAGAMQDEVYDAFLKVIEELDLVRVPERPHYAQELLVGNGVVTKIESELDHGVLAGTINITDSNILIREFISPNGVQTVRFSEGTDPETFMAYLTLPPTWAAGNYSAGDIVRVATTDYIANTDTTGDPTVSPDWDVIAWTHQTTTQIDHERGYISIESPVPFGVDLPVRLSYAGAIALNIDSLHLLRKTLGLFIDDTVFTDEDSLRRLISELPSFYERSGTLKMTDFLSYVTNVNFDVKELYTYFTRHSEPHTASNEFFVLNGPIARGTLEITYQDIGGTDYRIYDVLDGKLVGDVGNGPNTVDLQTGSGKITYLVPPAGDVTFSYANANYNEFYDVPPDQVGIVPGVPNYNFSHLDPDGVWYKTSHVNLSTGFTDIDFIELARVFYAVAPIHLILADVVFDILETVYSAITGEPHQIVFDYAGTNPASTAGITGIV